MKTTLADYAVTFAEVGRVDNQGAQCDICMEIGALVTHNVDYVSNLDGDPMTLDCCAACVESIVRTCADVTHAVIITWVSMFVVLRELDEPFSPAWLVATGLDVLAELNPFDA